MSVILECHEFTVNYREGECKMYDLVAPLKYERVKNYSDTYYVYRNSNFFLLNSSSVSGVMI